MSRLTAEQRAARDAQEKDAWIAEQLADAPPFTPWQITEFQRVLTPLHIERKSA